VHSTGSTRAALPGWVRVQVWTGVVPLAGFFVTHLALQASALWGPRTYASVVGLDRSTLGLAVQIVLIYLPLVVHAVLGAARFSRRDSAATPAWAGRFGRPVQQLSAAVLLIFVLAHFCEFPYRLWTGVIAPSDYYPDLCARLSSTAWGGIPLVAIGYLLGVAAAALHGAHGLYHAGFSLGLIRAERARRWAGACCALGVSLFSLGALIIIDLATG
jgi:succinate dehydrogenase / fumarate reductase cytochrome b subunit